MAIAHKRDKSKKLNFGEATLNHKLSRNEMAMLLCHYYLQAFVC